MSRFTKKLREQIVRDFAARHNSAFDPAIFVAEVERDGEEHPAYGWFEWDGDKAAHQHRLWQAREFVSGLRISFEVQRLEQGSIRVDTLTAPLVISPIQQRIRGGGYELFDHANPAHVDELCREAATALRGFIERFQAALQHIGVADTVAATLLKLEALNFTTQPEVVE